MEIIEFKKALPVWAENLELEQNIHMGFRCFIKGTRKARVYIACHTAYNLFINGKFIAFGPARTAKGYFCVDEIDVSEYLDREINTLAITVYSYNCKEKCYQYLNQNSFLACEVEADGKITAATGTDGFEAMLLSDYVRKTSRFSPQRMPVEVYRLKASSNDWKTDGSMEICKLKIQEKNTYIKREINYPEYERLAVRSVVSRGTHQRVIPLEYKRNSCDHKNDWGKETEENISQQLQEFRYSKSSTVDRNCNIEVRKNEFAIFDFERETTGMLSFKVTCTENTTFFIMFDEILKNGLVDPQRMNCNFAVKYYLEPGKYELNFFEPVSMSYANFVVTEGTGSFSDIHMVEYKHPPILKTIDCQNEKLQVIFRAAVETFRQNAVDIFMDCPLRERAGWLCDSFFLGRTEKFLTGDSKIEKQFLTNYLLEDYFGPDVKSGMVAMCYPAEYKSVSYIPNWAMWLVLQIEEYFIRSGDKKLIEEYKEKIYNLIKYFTDYENHDGLLQNLDGWVFVDWSESNNLVQDVNFPSNMMYAYMLEKVASLYGDEALREKAFNIKQKIRVLSFNGKFFCDNLVKTENSLVPGGKVTESCQYYAFFTGTATKELYPDLFNILFCEFKADRVQKGLYPEVYPSNAFIGNYIRFEVLARYGLWEQMKEEMVDYFYYMAEKTGTLWEKIDESASLNHGFASHVAVWLDAAFKKQS